MKQRPSTYLASGNVFFSCEGGEESLAYAIERLGGSECLLYASDFPHETNADRARHELMELRKHPRLSDEAKHNILRGVGVRRFYNR